MPLRTSALTAILMLACVAQAWAGGPAPADEYFGPFKESVLEIRNRLMAFERDSNWDLARHVRAIDNVEMAIEDWHRKYPGDPWIPGFSGRLAHVYERAHAARTRGCRVLLGIARR
jgi:hypothetical protein